jgi:hypothetical protein
MFSPQTLVFIQCAPRSDKTRLWPAVRRSLTFWRWEAALPSTRQTRSDTNRTPLHSSLRSSIHPRRVIAVGGKTRQAASSEQDPRDTASDYGRAISFRTAVLQEILVFGDTGRWTRRYVCITSRLFILIKETMQRLSFTGRRSSKGSLFQISAGDITLIQTPLQLSHTKHTKHTKQQPLVHFKPDDFRFHVGIHVEWTQAWACSLKNL